MEVTADHPVYVEEKGWIWAENLEAGDELQTAEGGWAAVVSVEHVHLDEPELVYNFTIRGPHTYFVLDMSVLVHNDSEGVCDPDAYPHLLNNLQVGGFSKEQSQEIVRRLYDAGVREEQLKLINDTLADTQVVGTMGTRLFTSGDDVSESFLVWRIANNGHLYSNFSKLDPREQAIILRNYGHDAQKIGKTAEEHFLDSTASLHAMGFPAIHSTSGWVSTAGNLAPLVRTTDSNLLVKTITSSDTLHLLKIPREKLNLTMVRATSEKEILVNALRDPLDQFVVAPLPNIFRDRDFTNALRSTQ